MAPRGEELPEPERVVDVRWDGGALGRWVGDVDDLHRVGYPGLDAADTAVHDRTRHPGWVSPPVGASTSPL
ncbi:hypothetical protein Acsp06_37030 [Actinomycetospora sp. NBRC 106375]|nr:hypothetical protein Acsp06_37030 [Actinomycetospora sp. NBRC 106375]